jgi:hypothetical protein
MEELLHQIEVAEREAMEAVGDLNCHNAERKVQWLKFCLETYKQCHYFGDLLAE